MRSGIAAAVLGRRGWAVVTKDARIRYRHLTPVFIVSAMAAQVVETLLRTQRAKNVSELRGWARKVGRFLLNGPPDVWVGHERPAAAPLT